MQWTSTINTILKQKTLIDLNIEYPVKGDTCISFDTYYHSDSNSISYSDFSTHQIEEDGNFVQGNNNTTERQDDDIQQPIQQSVTSPRVAMIFASYSEVIDFNHNFGL